RQAQPVAFLLGEGFGFRVDVEQLMGQPAAFDDAHQPLAVDEFYADTVWFACHHVQLQLVALRIASSNSNTI
ncbi:hypothetical protein, partial [Mesorhizobium sp.]|uniref:hypothetical protein n=3 Tax=Mesorhizobium sp. TaxID=1871066 RepID=UPI0025E8A100